MIVKARKRNKYNAKSVWYDNILFRSIKECERYKQLKLLLAAKEIYNLELQKEYKYSVDGKHIFSYLADFCYCCNRRMSYIIEDAKGFRTPLYKLKKKLIEAQHGITIVEV